MLLPVHLLCSYYALLPRILRYTRCFGVMLSPVHYRRRTPRPVSYYALFKWWLLLSQHPGCLRTPTSFRTERVLGTLAGDLGCSPLDDEAYPPSSHWPTLTPVILRSYLVFRVCLDLVPLSRPAPKQCFTPRCPVNCCASTHFGENQLALGSSGISPLTTTHLLILQHQSVRTST